MSDHSAIEWTDATWNPVRGCVKVSPGCAHCYAETFAERFRGVKGHPYEQGFDLQLVPEKLSEPFRWKKPRRVFVNSMSDLFQDGVPDEYIDRVFAVMALTPQHTYQVLTKRAERMREYMNGEYLHQRIHEAIKHRMGYDHPKRPAIDRQDLPLPNIWLGVSVENRAFKARIEVLREVPAAVRFLSIEPQLEDVGDLDLRGIGWVIVGGESGPGARPMDLAWARSIIAQCKAASVPCFMKQLGARPESIVDRISFRGSKTPKPDGFYRQLNDSKGGAMEEWPTDLRVREYPDDKSRLR